jgi:hypothetical protein
MSTTRRILVAVGAPLVLVMGLGALWGYRNAAALKAQVEAWADSLEHSPNPVEMRLAVLPMYVDGNKIGKLNAVVVQRHSPGAVDSLQVVVGLSEGADLDQLSGCVFHFDPDALEDEGPLGFKQAVQCLDDAGDLVRFGSVAFEGTGRSAGLYLEAHDLPCQHMSEGDEGACRLISDDIHRLREEIRHEVRGIRMEIEREGRKTTRVTVH